LLFDLPVCVIYVHSTMTVRKPLEKEIENYFVTRVTALGGVAEKTVSPSGRGYFDRVAVLPGGRVIFAEIKKPRGSHTPRHQMLRHQRYRALGCEVVLIKDFAAVDSLLPPPPPGA
jgi:hypothetical protein